MPGPARVVDCGPQGISRGRGSGAGFYTRAAMEDTSSQWQRLLLPVQDCLPSDHAAQAAVLVDVEVLQALQGHPLDPGGVPEQAGQQAASLDRQGGGVGAPPSRWSTPCASCGATASA